MKRREFLGLVAGGMAWPVASQAQVQTIPLIGFLSSRSPDDSKGFSEALRRSDISTARPRGSNTAGPMDNTIS